MIVDDDEALISALDTKFKNIDFDVTVALNGAEGITFVEDQEFDVILTDLHMPEKDGFALMDAVRTSKNAATPLYVITNLGSEEHCTKALKAGAKECFVKSKVSLRDVVEEVKRGVNRE